MKDIILPVTCLQCYLVLYALIGVTSLVSFILSSGYDILWFIGVLTGATFVATGLVFGMITLLTFYEEGKLPRFPIRCKCDKE